MNVTSAIIFGVFVHVLVGCSNCSPHVNKLLFRVDKRDENNEDEELYTIEFIFDTDISCAVRVFLLAREELNNGIARFDHSVSFEDNE